MPKSGYYKSGDLLPGGKEEARGWDEGEGGVSRIEGKVLCLNLDSGYN
jgi:hypothetical protein